MAKLTIAAETCKGCGLCADVCPKKLLALSHDINSKGKDRIIQEEGWAEPGTEPTHLILHFITSCGEAFYGGLGNTLWLDNVRLIM